MKPFAAALLLIPVLVGRAFQARVAGPERAGLQPSVVAGYPIRAVPLTSVRITDEFWAPKIETNRAVTIPHIMRQNERTGRVDNFLKAARNTGKDVVAVPYFAWNNRGKGEMAVWIPYR